MIRLKKFKLNIPLSICIFSFMIISILTIYSSMIYLSPSLGNLSLKQFFWYIIGFIIIFILIKLTNKTLYQYAWYIYITNILLLLLLLIIGTPINGSKCWFVIPGIGSFQPSEFMKISLMIVVSIVVSKFTEEKVKKITIKDELLLIFKIILIFLVPTIFTFLEPDTGAVLIYFIICVSILWISPIRKRWFILGIGIILSLAFIFLGIYFFKQEMFVDIFGTDLFYRIDRLLDWKDGTGMQLENSLAAIGSSGIFGHGYRNTPIYFPESGTDFIFAVFSSNFGLFGSIVLLLIVLYFDINLIKIAKEINNTKDKCMIAGIIGMLLYQQLQNIGMTLGLLPITGITLPYISYGGSSLLSYMVVFGIVLNIYNYNNKTIN